jgi:rhamnosyltransferase
MKRAVVFAHYDRQDVVDPYVYFYLKQLVSLCDRLIVVSTSALKREEITELESIGCDVITRENVGYDFMSYRAGIESINYQDFDELVICNDSVYGPFFDLASVFLEMQEKHEADFWGMTSGTDIAYHLQSYFLVFNRVVLNSDAFMQFWESVGVLDDKREIIKQYEVGLSQKLLTAGFKPMAYADYMPSASSQLLAMAKRFSFAKVNRKIKALLGGENIIPRVNISHFHWKELILGNRMPFIKVELVRDNPMQVGIEDYENVIRSVSHYDTRLIKNHLSRISDLRS